MSKNLALDAFNQGPTALQIYGGRLLGAWMMMPLLSNLTAFLSQISQVKLSGVFGSEILSCFSPPLTSKLVAVEKYRWEPWYLKQTGFECISVYSIQIWC